MATKCKRKKKHILARNELKKKLNVRATDNSPSEAKSKTVRIIEVNSSSDSFDDSDIESNASSQASGNCVISLTRNSDRDRESFNEDNSLLWQRQFYYFSTNEFRERNGYEHFPYHFVVYLYFRDISYQGSDFSPTESINFELMVPLSFFFLEYESKCLKMETGCLYGMFITTAQRHWSFPKLFTSQSHF